MTAAILTRLMHPTEYGLYALGLSIIFFLTMAVFEWLGLSLLRMAPTTKDPEIFFGTVASCLIVLLLACIASTAVFLLLYGSRVNFALTITSVLATLASAWFELKQRLRLAELREISVLWTSLGRAVLSAILVCGSAFVFQTAPAALIGLGVAVFSVGVMTPEPRLSFTRCRFDLRIFQALLRFGLPLAVSVGLATILISVDKWMLQILVGPHEVGLFTAATLIAQVPITALAVSLGPWSYSIAVQALEFRSLEIATAELSQHFVILFGIIAPASAGIIALSHNLAHSVLGAAYWESAVLLTPWLSAAALVSGIRAFYVDFAFQLGQRTSPLIWANLLAVLLNIGLDFLLIPHLGYVGAAMGSLAAMLVSFAVAAVASRRVFLLPLPVRDAVKILACSLIMFLGLRYVAGFSGILALVCQIAAGATLYVASILALNVYKIRHWVALKLAETKLSAILK